MIPDTDSPHHVQLLFIMWTCLLTPDFIQKGCNFQRAGKNLKRKKIAVIIRPIIAYVDL